MSTGPCEANAAAPKRQEPDFNASVQQDLSDLLKVEEYARLFEAFGELGEDTEESDIEFAAYAQLEVTNRGEEQA